MSNDDSTPAVNEEAADAAAADNVEKKMRLLIERHPNPDMSTYHVDRRLSYSTQNIDFTDESGEVEVDRGRELPKDEEVSIAPFQMKLAEKIYQVPGVRKGSSGRAGVSINEYEVTVTKGSAFDGLEVEREVVEIIAQSFELTVEELEVSVNDKRHLLAYYQRMDLMS